MRRGDKAHLGVFPVCLLSNSRSSPALESSELQLSGLGFRSQRRYLLPVTTGCRLSNTMYMRIVTWNCGMALARKAPSLLALNPDIAVVQECSNKSVDVLYDHGFSGLWFGANPNKGVGVFCNKKLTLRVEHGLFGKWVIPLRVHGRVDFDLLAIWACPVGTKRADNYIGEVHRCLVEHGHWFGGSPAVVAGDFNSNSIWDQNRPGKNHTEVVRLFASYGLISAYHTHCGEKQGAETRPTYYFYRHPDKPFHLDHVFVPKAWRLRSVEVGSFQKWGHLSDHVPLVVDVGINGTG
jgi:exodeoxyribonuclease III